jgi:putative peptidoglycan lipid II flippase
MASSQATEGGSLGRAGVFLASGTVVSRILGFVSAVILARTIGTVGSGADAFALANQLPNNVYALIAGGILTAILVPHIVRASGDKDGGESFVNKIVTLGFLVFLAIAVLATVLAPVLVSLYAQQGGPGEPGFSAADIALATALAYWCLPQILFYALYSLLSEVLNARRVYGPFTWAPVANNVVVIIGLLVFDHLFAGVNTAQATQWTPSMTTLLGASATAGVAAQAMILFLFWKSARLRFRPDFHWRGVGLGKAGRAAAWMFGMILVTQLAGIAQSNVASLATAEGDAGLAILRFSWLIFMLPHSVITVSLATAYFTQMSHHAKSGQLTAVADDFVDAARRIGMFMVLAAVGLIVVSGPFARVFSPSRASVDQMSLVIAAYSLGLLAFTLVFLMQRVFFSLDDTKTPFFLQILHAGVFVSLALLSASLPSDVIALGIALSTSLAACIQLGAGLVVLRRRLRGIRLRRLLPAYSVFLLAAGVASLSGVGILVLLGGTGSTAYWSEGAFPAGLTITAITGAMGGTYLSVLFAFRNRDLSDVLSGIRALLRRRHARPE